MNNIFRTLFKILGIILVVSIIVVFVQSYSFLSYSKEKQASIEKSAIDNNNPSLCEKLPTSIPDITPRSECYLKVALATKDPTLCVKELLGPYCYTQLAIKYKDVSMCSYGTSSDTHTCYMDVASEVGGTKTCDLIQDNDYRIWCYTVIHKQTFELCKQEGNEGIRNQCYYGLALNEKNGTLCNNIVNDNADKEDCVKRTQ